MKSEPNEDPIIQEIPVYLSKTLTDQLHVFQYPVRPNDQTYDAENIVKARVKSETTQVELEIGLHTKASTFDRSKGDQIALNVDGAYRDERDSEDNYYTSNTMDKLVLTSSKTLFNSHQYAIGVFGEGSLHVTPITSALTFRPSLSYLDLADKRSKHDHKDHANESETEEKIKKVTVRFERPETDRSKAMKEKSYSYLQKKNQEEPWIPVQYHSCDSEKSEFESRNLFCAYQNEDLDLFCFDNETYLKHLIPQDPEILTNNDSKELSLQDKVKDIMAYAKVVSYSELISAIGTGKRDEDANVVLKLVQNVAVLVQGNWVVKSDIVYPKDISSESLISIEIIQKARDCTLYLFTKNTCINRSSITELIDVPSEHLTEILEGISRPKGPQGSWEFLLPPDNGFLKRHSDVSQRQQMIWQSRYEQLSHSFKVS